MIHNLSNINIGKPKLLSVTLFLLIISTFTTFIYIPSEFKTVGGSCYQGIAVLVTNAIMIFCLALFIISFILTFFGKHKTSLLISSFSVVLWMFWAFASSIDNLIDGLLYFSFFTVASFSSVYYLIIVKKIRNIKNL
jgi:hypothetical protein